MQVSSVLKQMSLNGVTVQVESEVCVIEHSSYYFNVSILILEYASQLVNAFMMIMLDSKSYQHVPHYSLADDQQEVSELLANVANNNRPTTFVCSLALTDTPTLSHIDVEVDVLDVLDVLTVQ